MYDEEEKEGRKKKIVDAKTREIEADLIVTLFFVDGDLFVSQIWNDWPQKGEVNQILREMDYYLNWYFEPLSPISRKPWWGCFSDN